MPNPFDFIRRPIVGLGRKINQGVHALEDQFDPTRRQSMPQGADVNPAELDHVRQYLTPGINGAPNPATLPRPTSGAGNLSQAAGIPDESRAGNYASALGAPDTGGGVLMPASQRPTMPRVTPQGERMRLRPWDAPNEDVPQGQTGPVLIRRPGSADGEDLPNLPPGGQPPRPSVLDQQLPQPGKNYGIQRLDYLDQNSGRGLKQSLKSGLRGGLDSMRNGGRGGGFLGGLLGNLIDPRGEADREFAAGPGRRILENQEMQREDEMYGLKARDMAAQAAQREAQAARYSRPTFKDAPWGTYDDTTGKPAYERPVAPPKPITPKWEWVTGPDGKPRQVNVNDPSYKPDGLQPYNKPGAPEKDIYNVSPGGSVFNAKEGREVYHNPGKASQPTIAETRVARKEVTSEVSKHNAMRQRVVQLGNQLSRLPKTDPNYPATVDAFNAEKAQFDAESQRIQDTYGEDVENQDSSGAWPLFKVKARAATPTAARPAARGNNADAELIKKIQANPEAWAEKARAKGHTEDQIQRALKAAGVGR